MPIAERNHSELAIYIILESRGHYLAIKAWQRAAAYPLLPFSSLVLRLLQVVGIVQCPVFLCTHTSRARAWLLLRGNVLPDFCTSLWLLITVAGHDASIAFHFCHRTERKHQWWLCIQLSSSPPRPTQSLSAQLSLSPLNSVSLRPTQSLSAPVHTFPGLPRSTIGQRLLRGALTGHYNILRLRFAAQDL
jgi:hypothetical protein